MVDWTKDSLLQFHPGKCKSMRISSRAESDIVHNYYMNGQLLEQSYEEKDLGVIIDSKLRFDNHISSKIKKANSLVGLIRRSFEYMDAKMFKQLFTSPGVCCCCVEPAFAAAYYSHRVCSEESL